ncbi:MAG: hypothetical protein QOH09_2 [Pseudonocardiales bacterium]|nr:hypothetical protein [Pseudonocardiales bacterium]
MFRVVQRWHRESRSARGGCGWNARGWSEQGKRFRASEREAAATPGAFYYGHLRYEDDTAYPTEIESGLLRDTELPESDSAIGFHQLI